MRFLRVCALIHGQAFNITDDLTVPLDTYFGGLAEVADCRAPAESRARCTGRSTVYCGEVHAWWRYIVLATLPSRVHGARRGYTTRMLGAHGTASSATRRPKKTQRWLVLKVISWSDERPDSIGFCRPLSPSHWLQSSSQDDGEQGLFDLLGAPLA